MINRLVPSPLRLEIRKWPFPWIIEVRDFYDSRDCFYDRWSLIFGWEFEIQSFMQNYVIFFLHLSSGLPFTLNSRLLRSLLAWHQNRLKIRGITKRKQHGRSLLKNMWNKRVLCATTRHASHGRKCPSEQYAVSLFFSFFLVLLKSAFYYSQQAGFTFEMARGRNIGAWILQRTF